ncbi:MAG: hypothetical protein HY000_39810, partial [Planctomycetes bacterium]|nr:hypothetical protein [Planctomycetota bacterium]
KRRRPPLIVWSWGCGAPLGVLVWVALWHGFGGGTGIPDASTGIMAVCFWMLWVLGLSLTARPERVRSGTVICTSVLFILLLVRQAMPHGTSLLALEIDAALIGLLPYWLVKSRCGDGVLPGASSLVPVEIRESRDACPTLGEDTMHNFAVYVRQPEVAAGVAVCQLGVVET